MSQLDFETMQLVTSPILSLGQLAFDLSRSPWITQGFRSLLKSEGLRATDDDVIYVEAGWIDALNDTNERRRQELPRVVAAYERGSDLYSLGYLTYAYGYTQVRLSESKLFSAEQLPLFEGVG